MARDVTSGDSYGTSRRQFIAASTAVAGTTAVAGCSGNNTEASGADNKGLFSADITVTHWPLLMYNPPYQAALENGYFEEEGIDIGDIAGSSGGGTTVRNVVTGGLPFGEVATPAAVNAYYSGSPIKIVASAVQTPGTVNWVAPQGSDIQSMSDLEGATIGYTSAGSVTQNTAGLSVRRADALSVDDVEFQAMGGISEGLTGLEEGSIDVAANLDPVFSQQQLDGEPWQVVFWAKDYIPDFLQTGIIVSEETLEENPDVVRGFLRARRRGVEFVQENPTEAAEIYASYNEGFEAEVMEQALENVGVQQYYSRGEFTVQGLNLIEQGMRNIDLISREVEWTEIVDQSLLPEEDRIDISQTTE